jgi:hypothetical protein
LPRKIDFDQKLRETDADFRRILYFGHEGTPMDIVERLFIAAAAMSVLLIAAAALGSI